MSIDLTPPPERDFPTGRLQQRKEQLVSQFEAAHAPPHRRAQRRRRPLVLAGVAAVLAGVAVAALVLPLGRNGGVSPAAAAVLKHAARTAARQPVTAPPAPGQFVYTRSESKVEGTAVTHQQTINFYEHVRREAWIGPDGSGRIRESDSAPSFVTSADRAAWIAAGRPELTGDRNSDQTWGSGGLSYLDLSKLPTDPGRLRQLIENRSIEGGPPGDAETFTIIGDLLRETYAPPAVRSALYRIASELPGVELVGATSDHLGRPGTGIAYTSNGLSHELIFDPQTSALLAEQTVDEHGTVLDWTCYLGSGVVDSTTATH